VNHLQEVKETKSKNIEILCKKLTSKLEDELKFKISALKDKRKDLVNDYEEYKSMLDKINSKMISMSNVEIVQNSVDIKEQLDLLNSKSVSEFKKDNNLFDFTVDKLLSFESSKFILKPFSVSNFIDFLMIIFVQID
jgi:flagellar motility protein MotE (MotC chaperone)